MREILRILIIGNSLTAANDLPSMIEAIGRASGVEIECAAIALPNFGLQEHWDDGRALRAIRQGQWTHVVLQQGPTSLPESRAVLIDYARRFAPEIRRRDAHVVFYGVWPPRSRMRSFESVTRSYADAARAVRGDLAPAGDTWMRAWHEFPDLSFYGDDGFHPSPLGTYAAAVTIFEVVTGQRARQPSLAFLTSLNKEEISAIHRAAVSATGQKRAP